MAMIKFYITDEEFVKYFPRKEKINEKLQKFFREEIITEIDNTKIDE